MSAIVNTRFFVPDTSDFNVGVAWAGEDFTGADMVLTVTAQPSAGGATLLTADTDSARIRINDDGAGWQYFIPQDVLQAVPPGLQRVSQVVTLNGVSRTLFLGTWSRVVGGGSANGQAPIVVDGFNLPIEFSGASQVLALQSTGTPGDSAYEIWLAAGNRGTQADFLAALQGPMGPGAVATVSITDEIADRLALIVGSDAGVDRATTLEQMLLQLLYWAEVQAGVRDLSNPLNTLR